MTNEELYEDEIETPPDKFAASRDLHKEHNSEHDQAEEQAESQWQDEVDDVHADEPVLAPQPFEQQRLLDSLDELPMALTLRCGSLNLTLGDLRRTAAGTILQVSGITPGHATLCHGERVVAEGELVDIEGRLGLQITRMASSA
ncbi:FliM/FliN family flagellar motor switch protein [Pseudomonas sp. FP1740]|uniref:FliM/FliN family flagellar motor switch protein n=1 Tax=Pseudomonas sp. FP1740 TaxID=2954078 RepID=UPI002732EB8A|nr:FliM/FliN family flagellar motor switch protein [Pseudomonas sp. FP1740]WLG46829.1 FliM/FliN family flagellar motor switch protein [Pseudomonas sp. FP1740]